MSQNPVVAETQGWQCPSAMEEQHKMLSNESTYGIWPVLGKMNLD